MHVVAIDISDLKKDRGLVSTEEHGESFPQIPHTDRIPVGVEDFAFTEAVFQR